MFEARTLPSAHFPGFPGLESHVQVAGLDVYAAGQGGGPHVKAFDADGGLLASFFTYDPAFRGGVNLAIHDGQIVTGPGVGGGPHVETWSVDGSLVSSFFAFEARWNTGAVVSGGGVVITVGSGEWIAAYTPDGHALAGWHPGGPVTQGMVDSFAAFPRPAWPDPQTPAEALAWGLQWGVSAVGDVNLVGWQAIDRGLSLCPETVLTQGGDVHAVAGRWATDDPLYAGLTPELVGASGAYGLRNTITVATGGWSDDEIIHAVLHELGHRLAWNVFQATGRDPAADTGLGTEGWADAFAAFCLGGPSQPLAPYLTP